MWPRAAISSSPYNHGESPAGRTRQAGHPCKALAQIGSSSPVDWLSAPVALSGAGTKNHAPPSTNCESMISLVVALTHGALPQIGAFRRGPMTGARGLSPMLREINHASTGYDLSGSDPRKGAHEAAAHARRPDCRSASMPTSVGQACSRCAAEHDQGCAIASYGQGRGGRSGPGRGRAARAGGLSQACWCLLGIVAGERPATVPTRGS